MSSSPRSLPRRFRQNGEFSIWRQAPFDSNETVADASSFLDSGLIPALRRNSENCSKICSLPAIYGARATSLMCSGTETRFSARVISACISTPYITSSTFAKAPSTTLPSPKANSIDWLLRASRLSSKDSITSLLEAKSRSADLSSLLRNKSFPRTKYLRCSIRRTETAANASSPSSSSPNFEKQLGSKRASLSSSGSVLASLL